MTRDEFNQMLEAHGIVFVGDAAWRVAQLVAEQEREACAMVAETYEVASSMKDAPHIAMIFKDCAAAIRARSKT